MTREYAYNTIAQMAQAEWQESALNILISTLFLNSTMDKEEIEAVVEELAPKFMSALTIYCGNETADYGTKFEYELLESKNNFNSWMSKTMGLINFFVENGIRFEKINENRDGFISGEWEIYAR